MGPGPGSALQAAVLALREDVPRVRPCLCQTPQVPQIRGKRGVVFLSVKVFSAVCGWAELCSSRTELLLRAQLPVCPGAKGDSSCCRQRLLLLIRTAASSVQAALT